MDTIILFWLFAVSTIWSTCLWTGIADVFFKLCVAHLRLHIDTAPARAGVADDLCSYGTNKLLITYSTAYLVNSVDTNTCNCFRGCNYRCNYVITAVNYCAHDLAQHILSTVWTQTPVTVSFEDVSTAVKYCTHDVAATLNQRQWRWFKDATTSCAQWFVTVQPLGLQYRIGVCTRVLSTGVISLQ